MEKVEERIEEQYNKITINNKIKQADIVINSTIDSLKDKRGLLEQNVLNALRTFVEYASFKIYLEENNISKEIYNNETIRVAINYLKGKGKLKYIERLHYFLQITRSHYIENDDSAIRLMLKYYKYLIKLRNLFKYQYDMEILENIDIFGSYDDSTFSEYYNQIANAVEKIGINADAKLQSDKYYIHKIKPFVINKKMYYEVTLTVADSNTNKFDRTIAYTKLNIKDNYSVKISIENAKVKIFNDEVSINIINNWMTSIRGCELQNYAQILGLDIKGNNCTSNKDYNALMKILTYEEFNLFELVNLPEKQYKNVIYPVEQEKSKNMITILEESRKYIQQGLNGSNVLKYLLYNLKNRLIKDQRSNEQCGKLSNLYLKYQSIPFDQMPLCTSLYNHNPSLSDLYNIFNPVEREHELLARIIKNNTEINNKIYTPLNELKNFDNIEDLVQKYNDMLYWKHLEARKLVIERDYIYIHGYEDDTIKILNMLNDSTKDRIMGYKESFNYFLDTQKYVIDDETKKEILVNLYNNSCLGLLYGAAGTGKTKFIAHLCEYMKKYTKLCLANTNTAVENMRVNITNENNEFMTINKYIKHNEEEKEYDILIVDECSTVSNSDMKKVLEKCKYKMLLLVGDIYQIESITFGNWFTLAKRLINKESIHELDMTWRSNDENLLKFWNMVRNGDERIDEMIAKNNYSSEIIFDILNKTDDDEITLCLNYDGLYGINNINNYMQNHNNSKGIKFNVNTYKENDPIIFSSVKRFYPVIYNNEKGYIRKIEEDEDRIWFTIEINKVVNELDIFGTDLELLEVNEKKSLLRFDINKYTDRDSDEDNDNKNIIPFSVAYAVSFHKSQGLEYNSVKILITKEIDEILTHNMFYTAITRAKEKLKIYWQPETQIKILSEIKHRDNNKDVSIIKSKLNF